MMWFVRMRRLIGAMTLAMLMMPAAVMAAGSFIDLRSHEHMHSGNHAGPDQSMAGDKASHDKLLCSIVVPCEHGFCAGLGMIQLEQAEKVPGEAWDSSIARAVFPACPECRSPPPKAYS